MGGLACGPGPDAERSGKLSSGVTPRYFVSRGNRFNLGLFGFILMAD